MKINKILSAVLFSYASINYVHADSTLPAGVYFPSTNASSPDQVISNYTSQVDTNLDSNQSESLKTITLVNNTKNVIYPVIRAYNSQDGHEYRIYVGHQIRNNQFEMGLPPGIGTFLSKTTVAIPMQLWNAGQVEVFTTAPPIPTANSQPADPTALYAIDTTSGSTNYGDLIYRNNTALGFPLDDAYQLVEYTIENTLVDYDVSYVDHLYLPVAIEADGGTIGYMGNGMSVQAMQKEIQSFTTGTYTNGYFSSTQNLGWPFIYNPLIAGSSIKIPAAYNLFALADSASTFNPSQMMLQLMSSPSNENLVTDGLVNRWLGWVTGYQGTFPAGAAPFSGYFAANCGSDQVCSQFADTVTKVWNLAQQQFPNLTSGQLVEKIIGYDFSANFDNGQSGQPQPIYPDNENSFRDAVKSLLRGVPYPYWNYPESQWYPNPNDTLNGQTNFEQKYNLDPIVWFVHKDLNMAGYGFSIDDDTGNVQTPGSGFTIAVGGLAGLDNTNQYNPDTQQAVLLAPGWTSLQSTNLGSCNLNQNTGTDCPVSLTPISSQTAKIQLNAPAGTLQFTVGYSALNSAGVYPLVLVPASCSVTGSLDPNLCNAAELHADPDHSQFFIVPPPGNAGPPTTTSAMLYWGPNWNNITGCGIQSKNLNGAATAAHFNFTNQSNPCTVNLQGVNPAQAAVLDVSYDQQGNVTKATCTTGVNQSCPASPTVSATVVAVADASGLTGT